MAQLEYVGVREVWTLNGSTLGGVHDGTQCTGACVFHNPSDHHMIEWGLIWRNDRSIFERMCVHGGGHPDPDQLEYWKANNLEAEAIHGCDGCCTPSKK